MKLCGDVKENQGPKPSSNQSFSICHWNRKSISAFKYIIIIIIIIIIIVIIIISLFEVDRIVKHW